MHIQDYDSNYAVSQFHSLPSHTSTTAGNNLAIFFHNQPCFMIILWRLLAVVHLSFKATNFHWSKMYEDTVLT